MTPAGAPTMHLTLFALYVAAGIACAAIVRRRSAPGAERNTSTLLALVAWPLWAPVALSRESPPRVGVSVAERRIDLALSEALAAVADTPLAALLPEDQARAVRRTVERAAARVTELEAMVARPELDARRAEARLSALIDERAPARTLASARVHLENARKLEALLACERRALEDLADLADALRTQLVLARYAGSSLDGVGDIVGEVWARVQGLDAAMGATTAEPGLT